MLRLPSHQPTHPSGSGMTATWKFCKLNKLFYKFISYLQKFRPPSKKQCLWLKSLIWFKRERQNRITDLQFSAGCRELGRGRNGYSFILLPAQVKYEHIQKSKVITCTSKISQVSHSNPSGILILWRIVGLSVLGVSRIVREKTEKKWILLGFK